VLAGTGPAALQVLQKQVEQLEQQLSMAMVMERKLQSELADVQAAREKDQAEAAHEVRVGWLRRHGVMLFWVVCNGCRCVI
jgi:hypothetical protein